MKSPSTRRKSVDVYGALLLGCTFVATVNGMTFTWNIIPGSRPTDKHGLQNSLHDRSLRKVGGEWEQEQQRQGTMRQTTSVKARLGAHDAQDESG